MQNKELMDNMKNFKIKRNKDGIITFKNIPKVFDALKKNPDGFDDVTKRVIVENFYENLRFVSLHIDVRLFLQKYKINRNLDLKNEQDLNTIYNFLLKIININTECDSSFCHLFFVNHKQSEYRRKRICEKSDKTFNKNKAIFESLIFYESHFEGILSGN